MAQIGTVRLETQNSGVVDVPVFESGDSASGIYEFVRVETESGPGFIPVTDPVDATYPYLRVQSQNNGIVAVTDTAGSDIPDSVVTRPADNDSTSTTDYFAALVEVTVEFPSIGMRLSDNTQNATRVRVARESDNTILGETTGSFSANDTVTVDLSTNMVSGETYGLRLDAEGASYTAGYYVENAFPFNSPDGNISIVGADIESASSSLALVFDEIGNVGF